MPAAQNFTMAEAGNNILHATTLGLDQFRETPAPVLITATAHFILIPSEPEHKGQPGQRFAGCQR